MVQQDLSIGDVAHLEGNVTAIGCSRRCRFAIRRWQLAHVEVNTKPMVMSVFGQLTSQFLKGNIAAFFANAIPYFDVQLIAVAFRLVQQVGDDPIEHGKGVTTTQRRAADVFDDITAVENVGLRGGGALIWFGCRDIWWWRWSA